MTDLADRLRRPWTDFYVVKDGAMTGLLEEAADEIERLGRCLRIAAGMLSTIEEFSRCHPEEVLAHIEATEVGSRNLGGEP